MKKENFAIVTALLTSLLIASLGMAQQAEPRGGNTLPCSPKRSVLKGSNPATYDPAGLPPTAHITAPPVFNQTQINTAFAYTFKIPDMRKDCCRCREGSNLTVTFKALQGGPANSSTSSNDDVIVTAGSGSSRIQLVSQRVWTGATKTGQTETLTFPIPCAAIERGEVTLYEEDDTAVVSAVLTVESCCLQD